jgi:hypothetical protein
MPVGVTKTLATAEQSKYTAGYNDNGKYGNPVPTTGVTFVNRGTIGVSTTQWGPSSTGPETR